MYKKCAQSDNFRPKPINNKVSRDQAISNIKRFIPYLKPQFNRALIAGFFMLLSVLLQLPLPLVTRYLIDYVLLEKRIVLLHWMIIGLFGVMLMQSVSQIINNYLLTLFRERILFEIQIKLFQHIQKLNLSFFKRERVGYLMARISNDVSNLQGLLAKTALNFFIDSLTFIFGAIIIFIFHWKLALASLAVLPFFIFSIQFFSRKIRLKSHEIQEKNAIIIGALKESLSGIFVVKSFQTEKHEALKYAKKLRGLIRTRIRFSILNSLFSVSTAFIGGIGPLIVLWYGGKEVINGNLTLGTFVAFIAFLGYLFGPTQRLMDLNADIQNSLASLNRVFVLLDVAPEHSEPSNPIEVGRLRGKVEFKNVTFSYDGLRQVLKNISFIAEPGRTIALVGKSGAGKTTLVNLIPRFYDPQHGNIFIDGINIKEMRIRDLRKVIGIVPQESFLFSGTIKENIKYGRQNATDQELLQAAKLANVDKFIDRLSQKYNSESGEEGKKLSGGERQRIAIARAILKDPIIIIFDEATSELDSESEKTIQDALKIICKDRTTFIIAHRLSTAIKADIIWVLDNGIIIDTGTHEELCHRCECYRDLCEHQLITLCAQELT